MDHRPHPRVALLCAVLALAASALAGSAWGAAANPVIADCNAHGKLTRTYTLPQLQLAITTMSVDVKEYTDCYDVINRALLAQTSKHSDSGGNGGGSGGSFLPTPVIVILVVLLLAAATFGAMAVRRRREDDDPHQDDDR
jgi:hypothetical protein